MSLFSVTNTGLITVDSSDIREEFEEAYKQALGSSLNLEVGTPQGQLITIDTKMLTYAQNQCADLANVFSVLTSTGKALDVAGGFWGYYRKQGVGTVVNCTLKGKVGTVIPAGSIASDGEHDFTSTNQVTIGEDGFASVQFQCVDKGSIPCLSGTLNTIVSVIDGWDSVSNDASGIVGYDVESDNVFRQRITANWFNIRGRGSLGAIADNMAQIDNVLSVLARENMTNNPIQIDDQTLLPHSVYVCILGGSDADIATVMYQQKTCGANTNGNTSIPYIDTRVGISMKYKIQRPAITPIKVKINYSLNYYTPADIVKKIKENVIGYVQQNPFSIGQTISGNQLANAFNDFPYCNLLSVKIGVAGEEDYNDYLQMTIAQYPTLSEDDIECVEL